MRRARSTVAAISSLTHSSNSQLFQWRLPTARPASFSPWRSARIHDLSKFLQRATGQLGGSQTGNRLSMYCSDDVATLPYPLPFAGGNNFQLPTHRGRRQFPTRRQIGENELIHML